MLSICIPTYNYRLERLVDQLHAQSIEQKLNLEILLADDASTDRAVRETNSKLAKRTTVSYFQLDENIGRAAIRNFLAARARYDMLLFLDCDTFPETEAFLKNYIEESRNNPVLVGGIVYHDKIDDPQKSLRHKYGQQRETILAEERAKKPYASFMTGNFMIHKNIFKLLKFDESIREYGHEDTLFGIRLKNLNIPVKHLHNRVFHEGLESNKTFIEKTKKGIDNLYHLYLHHQEKAELIQQIKILSVFDKCKKSGLIRVLAFILKIIEPILIKRIDTPKPSISAFDLFKLSYLCQKATR